MSSQHGHAHPVDASAGYEKSDAHIKPVVIFAVVLFVGTAATIVAMTWLFNAFEAMDAPKPGQVHPLAQPAELPPAPRLQPNPGVELREYQAQTNDALTTYSWLDKQAGVVRLPIERALQLTAERGLPHRK